MSDRYTIDLEIIINAQRNEIKNLREQVKSTNEKERALGFLAQSNLEYTQALIQTTWYLIRLAPKSNVQKFAVCYHEISDLFTIVKQYCANIIPFPELVLPNQVLAALNITGFNLYPVEKSHKQRGQIVGINDYSLETIV